MAAPAELTFAGLDWFWPAAIGVLVGALFAVWSYAAAPAGVWRWVCAGLKTCGVALLAFCLIEPFWASQRARPGANVLALVADNSQGLQARDRGAARSRGEGLRELLAAPDVGWQARLAEDFELRRFRFDTRLRRVPGFGELNFSGRASALGGALREVAERFRNRPLAGVLLFTDGIATDLAAGVAELPESPPVYPVLIGRSGGVRDAALSRVSVRQSAFEAAAVGIDAEATVTGMAGETLVAALRDSRGRRLQEQRRRVDGSREKLSFRFRFTPEEPGLSFYRIELGPPALAEGGTVATNAPATDEATLLNNTRVVAVDRGRAEHRILYVAGRPNWEYKFLNRALQEDPQLSLVALIRVALREPKFQFRGRVGETGNPLFRGFGDQSREEVARYDQPVITRLNTKDEQELQGGFPRTPEELYAYEAVILDDVEAGFFSADRQSLLERFVSERGGGLLMLGGAESLREGGYDRTPIGDVLPVYLDGVKPVFGAGGTRLELAREGWLEPWARLRETEAEERARRAVMPDFRVTNPVREAKPAARVVATAKDADGEPRPALVTQRFGRGRSAVLTVGDLWRWGMRNPEARADMNRFWRQLARWLVTDTPGRVELAAVPRDEPPGSVDLQVRVRDAAFRPLDDASVTLQVRPAPGFGGATNRTPLRLRTDPSGEEPGLFTARFTTREPGGYLAEVTVTNNAGLLVGRAAAGWSTDLAAEELRSLEPNAGLLEAIAKRTGGRVVTPAGLGALVRELPHRQAPVMETATRSAWHTPWIFLTALGCFLVEWGVRRWRGLP